MKHLVVAITGASGAIIGIRLLQVLRNNPEYQVHLIISRWGEKTITLETSWSVEDVRALADACYEEDNLSAAVSSGSFRAEGYVIVPCSMKTLSSLAHGFSHNLIGRVGDVALKERRPLVLVTRETPLSTLHLQNMLTLSSMGAIVLPPAAAFYFRPQTLEDMVNFFVGKILDTLGIEHDLFHRWS